MDQIPRISEAIYVNMCLIDGTPTLVSIRREVASITETIRSPVEESGGFRVTLSGSRREGFGPAASDMDFMVWLSDHHIIWDLNHADQYDIEMCTLILMECSEERPGFALLQLLTPTSNTDVRRSCVSIWEGIYISSTTYRKNTLSLLPFSSTQHGPCASGMHGPYEYDFALCFECKFWPSTASSFTLRCLSRNWPQNRVLIDIINSGCHVVPIGFKGSPQEDCEWRISFSKAEQKLVYCMNHTQFICYGLLKIFLKEVLIVKDSNGNSLLCSYFMKTVLFWVIQNNVLINWNPSSLLSGFWLCFKFLFSCVNGGYLPNFFIPENNMFKPKIVGHSQHLLIERLFETYNQGIACLLHCTSIRDCLTRSICNRQYVLATNESDIISESSIDFEFFVEIVRNNISGTPCFDARQCFTNLQFAVRYLSVHAQNLSTIECVTLRKCISSILRCNVYHFINTSNNLNNKRSLRIIYACFNLLEVSKKMGCYSDKIYSILFLYSIGKTRDAVKNLREVKNNITYPYMAYSGIVYQQEYSDEMRGLSLSEKMGMALTMDINLPRFVVKELELEFRITTNQHIYIPPSVMIRMLLVLCYRGNQRKQQEALYELYCLLHYDDGRRYISALTRDISWQILGICQQICGDHRAAILSYQTSLKQIPHHNIQAATFKRIQDALYMISFQEQY